MSRDIADTLAGLVVLVGVDRTCVDHRGVVEDEHVGMVVVDGDRFAGVVFADIDPPGEQFEHTDAGDGAFADGGCRWSGGDACWCC